MSKPEQNLAAGAIDQIDNGLPGQPDAERSAGRRAIPPAIKGLFQILVGVGALAYILSRSSSQELIGALRATEWWYFPLALAPTAATFWLMAYRWKVILSVRAETPSTLRLFVYYLIGTFFGNFVPGGTLSLDFVRMLYAGRDMGDRPFVVTSLLYDRFIGMVALLSICLAAAALNRAYLPSGWLVYLAEGILIVVIVVSLFLFSDRLSNKISSLALAIGKRAGLDRPARALAGVLWAMTEIRDRRDVIATTAFISVLMRAIWTLAFLATARAMHLPLSLGLLFAVISVVDLIRMLPITPNGLGLREGAMILLLGHIGISSERALMFSLLAFAPMLFTAVCGGVIYVFRTRLSLAV